MNELLEFEEFFFFSSRRRHTRFDCDWSSDVCSSDLLDAWAATRLAAERCRAGQGPAMLIAETFRMGGHATHDEREARATFPDALFKAWGKRDPVGLYEEWLKQEGVPARRLEQVEAEVTEQVE